MTATLGTIYVRCDECDALQFNPRSHTCEDCGWMFIPTQPDATALWDEYEWLADRARELRWERSQTEFYLNEGSDQVTNHERAECVWELKEIADEMEVIDARAKELEKQLRIGGIA